MIVDIQKSGCGTHEVIFEDSENNITHIIYLSNDDIAQIKDYFIRELSLQSIKKKQSNE